MGERSGDNTALVGCQCVQARRARLAGKARQAQHDVRSSVFEVPKTSNFGLRTVVRLTRHASALFTLVACHSATTRYESSRLLSRLPFAGALGKMGAV